MLKLWWFCKNCAISVVSPFFVVNWELRLHNVFFVHLIPNQSKFWFINLLFQNDFWRNIFPGIVLFTFLHFNETPAIVTSVVIGLGIVFCGGAVIHNVFVWQRVSINSRDCLFVLEWTMYNVSGHFLIINPPLINQEKTVITKGNGTILNSTTTKELYKRASILGQSHIVLPHATLDLSNGFNGTITAKSLELSTLV